MGMKVKLDQILSDATKQGDVTGVVATVGNRQGVLYEAAFGKRCLGAGLTTVELNFDTFKERVHTLKDFIIFTPSMILAEEDKFLKVRRFNKLKEADVFSLVTVSITYKDGKIINQQYLVEELDHDPREGQDWNWEDYE